jgi:M6 family metalloprotease-like protein
MRLPLRITGAAALLLLLGAVPLLAQRPRLERGRFEVHGYDFARDGAWRKRAGAVRAQRRQLLRSGDLSALNAAAPHGVGPVLTGSLNMPVLPIAFSNRPSPAAATPELLHDKLFHDRTSDAYSLKTYFEQMSNGNLGISGTVFPWMTTPQPDTYYENGCNGPFCQPVTQFGEMLVFGIATVSNGPDAATVWAPFDNDGPDGVPNSGDDDGFVDFVTFVHPEIDGACGTSNIWAHRWTISSVNGGSPYVTQTPWEGHPGQFIKVQDYTIQSAIGGPDACSRPDLIMPIGTVAHETGHTFGIPDLYDTSDPATATEGIGEWGLMGSGNYARAYSPARMEAWSLFELGWVKTDTLRASGTIRLGPVQTSDTVLVALLDGTDEYLLLENRAALESDTAMFNTAWTTGGGTPRWKQPGLLIWHIDQGQIANGSFSNSVNAGPVHGVALVQADGRNDLRTTGGGNRGDAGDAYGIASPSRPGAAGNRRYSGTTTPANLDNQNVFPGFVIDSIHEENVGGTGPIVFRFMKGPSTVVKADKPGAEVVVRGVPTTEWRDILGEGDTVTVSVEQNQVQEDGRSRFAFASWSNGGPRTQLYTAGATTQDLVAHLTAEYRVDWTVAGGGAVTATSGGATFANAGFAAGGTAVTLTANVPTGATFTGWTGDTTTTNPELVLPMERPYAVTATFTGAVAVTIGQAVDALLGGAALGAAQATYLDQTGNHNGAYDLGDFLAYADRTGQPVSPELMQRLMSAPKKVKQTSSARGAAKE